MLVFGIEFATVHHCFHAGCLDTREVSRIAHRTSDGLLVVILSIAGRTSAESVVLDKIRDAMPTIAGSGKQQLSWIHARLKRELSTLIQLHYSERKRAVSIPMFLALITNTSIAYHNEGFDAVVLRRNGEIEKLSGRDAGPLASSANAGETQAQEPEELLLVMRCMPEHRQNFINLFQRTNKQAHRCLVRLWDLADARAPWNLDNGDASVYLVRGVEPSERDNEWQFGSASLPGNRMVSTGFWVV